MTTVDIFLVLAFGPIVLGLVVPFAVAALVIMATDAREAYTARGMSRRALRACLRPWHPMPTTLGSLRPLWS